MVTHRTVTVLISVRKILRILFSIVMKFLLIGKKHKLGHLRVDTQGNATFKHLPTNQLVQALQLGIQYSVGGLEARPAHDVLYQDFVTVELIQFPK